MSKAIYDAVKAGIVKIGDLTPKGRKSLASYMEVNFPSKPPTVSGGELRMGKEPLGEKVKRIGYAVGAAGAQGTGLGPLMETVMRKSEEQAIKKGRLRPEQAKWQKPFVPLESPEFKGTLGEKIAYYPTFLASALAPIGGAEVILGRGAAKVVTKAIPKAVPKVIKKVAEVGARGAGTGFGYGAGTAALEGKPPKEVVKRGAADAALFAVADVALTGFGKVAKLAWNKLRPPKAKIEPPRALPPAVERKALPPTGEIKALPPSRVGEIPEMTATEPFPAIRQPVSTLKGEIAPPAKDVLGEYAAAAGIKQPFTTQTKAETEFYKLIEDMKQVVAERNVPPMESTKQLVNFVYENFGRQISKNEIRKLSYAELADLSETIVKENPNFWGLAKQEAKKRGVDLEDLYHTAVDPEYARWKDVVGLGEPRPKLPGGRTEEELNAARNVLRKVQDPDRAARVLEVHPELQAEFPDLVKTLRQAAKPPKITQPKAKPVKAKPTKAAGKKIKAKEKAEEWLLKAETAAQERVKSRGVRMYAGIPLEDLVDYSIIGAAKIARHGLKFAEWSSEMVAEFGEKIKPHLDEIWKRSQELLKKSATVAGRVAVRKEAGAVRPYTEDVTKFKDISGFKANIMDVSRIFEDVFGKEYPTVKKSVLDPFDASKKASIEWQEKWLNNLKTEVVDKLGIEKGSRESKYVQLFGEKRITLDQLKQKMPDKWQDIVKADKWFRDAYDDLLNQVNKIRAQIYPRNPEKIIPRREDYYRHFREMSEGFEGLSSLFEVPARIDPKLAGISAFTQPKTRWLSFAQKRLGGKFKADAVGGFLNYIPSASNAIHIDPHISVFRNLSKSLAKDTEKTGNLNNFILYLQRFADSLAGKTNMAERWIQEVVPGGRATFRGINWLSRRVRSNMILGNLRSALSQTLNIPAGVGYVKKYAVPGAGKTLSSIFQENKEIAKSGFIKERYAPKMYRQFDTKLLEQPRKLALWLLETSDRIATEFIWNSAYLKGVAEKATDPIKYADDITRRTVAGRGVGEVPLLQQSRIIQLIAPFQVEVGNLWFVMKDFVKARDFSALVTLFVGTWLMDKALEKTTGFGGAFDPIDAIYDAMTMEGTGYQRAGRVIGEGISNVPLGQTIAAIYPEHELNIQGLKLPGRKEFFGEADPSRFGTTPITRAFTKPGTHVLLPFGGAQIEKTYAGAKAVIKQGAYTGEKLKYPINTDTVNALKTIMFGPSAAREAKQYYEKGRRPLSEKQTQELERAKERGVDVESRYERIMINRRIETIEDKMREVRNNKELPIEKRLEKIEELKEQKRKLVEERVAL